METRIGKSHDVAAASWTLCDEQIVDEPHHSIIFHCYQPITGSLIMLQLLQYGIIHACEIQVYGDIFCEYSIWVNVYMGHFTKMANIDNGKGTYANLLCSKSKRYITWHF